MRSERGSTVLINCTFVGNTASLYGGAIFGNFSSTNYVIKNSIFWNNTGTIGYNFFFNNQGATADITYSIVQEIYSGTGNLNSDPLFVNPTAGNYSLQACSPAINAGDNTGISGVDLANNPRIYNNGVVDMGAYEFQGVAITAPTNVSISATTACEGTSVNLTATCSSGSTVTWYNVATGGTSIGTGSPFSYTAPVGNNQTFYASCVGSCETARVATSNTLTVASTATRLYVNASATGAKTGLSWADAFTDLQSALNYTCKTNLTEIWVAAGTYKPTTGTDRNVSFSMLPNVKIYGGFPNTGTPSMAERNWTANPTILSGDLNSNDVITGSGSTLSITNNNGNSYNVVFNPVNSNLELNGFTISGGNANLGSGQYSKGGGLYISNQLYNSSSANLTNIIFSGNRSTIYGGGLHLRNVPIANLTNVIFDRNISNTGGGIYNENSGLKLKNAIFSGNNVISGGGGGLLNYLTSSTELTNVTFVGNNASSNNGGGGIFNTTQTYPILKNCVFWQNTHNASTTTGNRDIFNYGSDVSSTVSNSLLQLPSNSYNTSFPNITTSNNIFAQDPLFVNASNPAGTDNIFGTADDGLMLSACSPAVNTGDNTANTTITDLAGNNRVFNTTIDMGAYETQSLPPTRLYVNGFATGANTGLSWADAFTDLQSALNYTCKTNLTEIWVAADTYKPHATDRNISFSMLPNVKIYGGFPNTGTPTMTERNWKTNPTILSGDLSGNDVVTGSGATLNIANNGENSYHVIVNDNNGLTTNNSLLDGFTVMGGNANSNTSGDFFRKSGGGMYNSFSSPSLSNVTFLGNYVSSSGGGICNYNSSPSVINVIFSGNYAGYQGGGMYTVLQV